MLITTAKDLRPNLQRFLPNIPEASLFYKNYNLKHPSALYNTSLSKLFFATQDFLKIYEKYTGPNFEDADKSHSGELLKTYKDVLYTLREHLDDCYTLIKIFVPPPQNEKKERNQHNWLRDNASKEVQDLLDLIKEYKLYLDKIVTELKHNNAMISGISFYDNARILNCPGYFIANVISDIYQPVESIHPKYNGQHTGTSFRRDLHFNYFNVYRISEEILNFVQKRISLVPENTQILPPNKVDLEMFSKMMNMSRIHFPNEYSLPVPSVSLMKNEILKLEYPSQLTIKQNDLKMVVISHAGDGHTRSFSMLYHSG